MSPVSGPRTNTIQSWVKPSDVTFFLSWARWPNSSFTCTVHWRESHTVTTHTRTGTPSPRTPGQVRRHHAHQDRFHRGERHVKGHRTWFSMFALALTAFSERLPGLSAPHCVSIGPRKRKAGGGSPPLPDGPLSGRRPKQKAVSANRRAGNPSTLESKRRRNNRWRRSGRVPVTPAGFGRGSRWMKVRRDVFVTVPLHEHFEIMKRSSGSAALLGVGSAPRGSSAPRGRQRSSGSAALLGVGSAPRGRQRSSGSAALLGVSSAPRGQQRFRVLVVPFRTMCGSPSAQRLSQGQYCSAGRQYGIS
ncbi:hypothetical protein EYF80_049435 [Liparis tanakae]|uniref:Uncharacterized protein n=1 Tax=Liparis tanakae TaxID=230148 RepID=A0A4Z2FHK6_9TELE|nr:hypothetical protein EYF80_049435 [Liparis tanakae]